MQNYWSPWMREKLIALMCSSRLDGKDKQKNTVSVGFSIYSFMFGVIITVPYFDILNSQTYKLFFHPWLFISCSDYFDMCCW